MRLPAPRGPLTAMLVERLCGPPGPVGDPPAGPWDDPLDGEDAPLALYLLYELHYRSFDEVDDRWEWEPSLLALRARLEDDFERALRGAVAVPAPEDDLPRQLFGLLAADDGPSLSRRLARSGTLEQFREFVIHRSAYHLKEADPHTWAIPRLHGGAKAALVEIQADEYGGGREHWMHSALFARAMRALGIDDAYGAHIDRIPGATLALVNLMSLFGLHRRLRGALVGHLAVLEMTSSEPMRRYAAALRRLGQGEDATAFYDEHVEADAVHEQVAAHDMAGRLARDEPALAADILFGAACVVALEARFAERLIAAWDGGRSSLLPARSPVGVA
ncbi:iron-containing redox enzyme family protein [Miltoncostaea marina]|uniref:iron-containing redox enzyme family protein n=1 Tax=Miltoncostaea marina TaxID=2843215 RepID=UPI001C3D3BB2|nr:iron-containing redox enzyme family protein [Miltoncostaea marina]